MATMTIGLHQRKSALLTAVGVALLLAGTPCGAAEPLKMTIGTVGYPLEILDANGVITGGLMKDMGDQLAKELGAPIQYITLSRSRIEPGLLSGDAHIVCYSHPNWLERSKDYGWTIPNAVQIERVVGLKNTPLPKKVPQDFVGKRVAVHVGYHFEPIQPLFDAGTAKRMDESKVAIMFKDVEMGLSDLLITSEGEIEGYFHVNPDKRKLFAVSKKPFSIFQTQCAVSPKSAWPLAKIDAALAAMLKRGDFDRMTKKYKLSMH